MTDIDYEDTEAVEAAWRKRNPMTDPEARLAAALLAALKDTGYLLTHEYADSGVIDVGDAMVRADPTLAADLALGAAVRESGLVDAAKALDRFMRQPDENEDGTPADWAPGLDAIGDFQNAVAIIKAAKEASEPDASPAGADGTATRQDGGGSRLLPLDSPKPGGTT